MNNKEKNTILYYGLGFVSIIIFSFLIAFQSSFERILPLAIILATTLAAFSSLKLGIYGPIYLMMILIPFSQSVTLFSIAGRPVNLGMHTIMVGWIILFTLISQNYLNLQQFYLSYLVRGQELQSLSQPYQIPSQLCQILLSLGFAGFNLYPLYISL